MSFLLFCHLCHFVTDSVFVPFTCLSFYIYCLMFPGNRFIILYKSLNSGLQMGNSHKARGEKEIQYLSVL